GAAPTDPLGRVEDRADPARGANPNLPLETRPADDGLCLSRLERRPVAEHPRGGDATAPAVPTAVRDRDELPAEEPGRGEYDQSEPGLSSLAGRSGLPAASGVGRVHRANCPEPA